MKKMIIAAAIVCAAALSQAATFAWNIEDIKASSGTGFGDGYLVYFMEVANYASDLAVADLSKGNTDFLSKATYSGAADSEGYLSQKKLGSYDPGAVVSGYAVILDSDSPASAKNFIVTGTETITFPDNGGNKSIAFGSQASVSYTPMSSSPDPIPEPTSGLLLVLGIAGLALRRKQK